MAEGASGESAGAEMESVEAARGRCEELRQVLVKNITEWLRATWVHVAREAVSDRAASGPPLSREKIESFKGDVRSTAENANQLVDRAIGRLEFWPHAREAEDLLRTGADQLDRDGWRFLPSGDVARMRREDWVVLGWALEISSALGDVFGKHGFVDPRQSRQVVSENDLASAASDLPGLIEASRNYSTALRELASSVRRVQEGREQARRDAATQIWDEA